MATVTVSIASREALGQRALAAFEGRQQGAHISFSSAELLWETFTKERWQLLHAMIGQGSISLRTAARRANRDVRTVRRDAEVLRQAGILEVGGDGRVVFPYDAVHFDFMLYPIG